MTADSTLFADRDLRAAWIAGYEAAVGVGIWNERFDGRRLDIFEAADAFVAEAVEDGGDD